MKVLKILLASTFLLVLSAVNPGGAFAQDTPGANQDLRVWVGGGLVTGAEDEFKPAERSLAVAGGVYFPSNVIPIPGFHSFIGGVYNRASSNTMEEGEVRTWDAQFRFIYYMKFSTEKMGLFLLFGPDYEHVDNDDPLQFSGSLFQAATGVGGYLGVGDSDTRISFVAERDFLGDINHRDYRVLLGVSKGFNASLF